MLGAQRGDCVWLTYGEPDDLHHVIIDAGPAEAIGTLVPVLEKRISKIPGDTDRIELLVVTHVDADHIQGVVSLLSDPARMRLFKDVWFNGYQHLVAEPLDDAGELLGGPDGERLTAALNQDRPRWNQAFDGGAVAVPDDGPLPVRQLAGGLQITLLAPGHTALARLAPKWESECKRAGILAGEGAPIVRAHWRRDALLGFDIDVSAAAPFRGDASKANAASIACIATYQSKSVLLLADAPAKSVIAGLDRIGRGPHRFAAVKLSHHGSRFNTSLRLCQRIQSRRWLVSTNGARFGHPDPECLARVIATQRKPQIIFNYVTEFVREVSEAADDSYRDRYTVKLPRRLSSGGFATLNSVEL